MLYNISINILKEINKRFSLLLVHKYKHTIQLNLSNFVITFRKLNVRLTTFNGRKLLFLSKCKSIKKRKYYY